VNNTSLSIVSRTQKRKSISGQSRKRGRNQPCSCGSGKKHKKCCWSFDLPRQRQPQTILRELVCSWAYAEEYDPKCVSNETNKRAVLKWLNDDGKHPGALTKLRLIDHWAGDKTFHYAGNGNPHDSQTLVCIDIDCHTRGTREEAERFARFLARTFFPDAPWEPSTYGRGVHLYVILDKTFGHVGNCPAEFINEKLHRLELRLQEIAAQFDVEGIEVRGRCPEIHYHDGKASNISYGEKCFAKVPRDKGLIEKLTTVTIETLDQVTKGVRDPEDEYVMTTGPDLSHVPIVRGNSRPKAETPLLDPFVLMQFSLDNDDPFVETCIPVPELRKHYAGYPDAGTSTLTKYVQEGSLSGWYKKERAKIDETFDPVARRLLKGIPRLRTKDGKAVTVEDMAIALYILHIIGNDMNEDGQLPTNRVRTFWLYLKQVEITTRGWDESGSRWRVIRDCLTMLGCLDWTDHTYWFVPGKHCGQSCKWCPNERFYEMVEESSSSNEEGGGDYITTEYPLITPVRLTVCSWKYELWNDADKITTIIRGSPLAAA
jgi:hypothetical protein